MGPGCDAKLCQPTLFLGPSESELHSSKKGPVICQDEKPSPSEKRHLKGILKY